MNQTGDKPISNLGFPSESTIMISDKTEQPRDAKTDKNGNLVEFKIGPETNESQVEVKYVNPNDQNPVVDNVQLSRPDGQKISYQRERSDPQDANSPFSYSETRDNMKGNLQFPGVEVGKDGKVSVFSTSLIRSRHCGLIQLQALKNILNLSEKSKDTSPTLNRLTSDTGAVNN